MSNEKRQHKRYEFLVSFEVKLGSKRSGVQGFDISQGGISFVSPEKFKVGSKLEVFIKHLSFLKPGKVASVGAVKAYPGIGKYGVQFDTPLAKDDFIRIVTLYKDFKD